jgi:hypothetical protein
MQQDATLCILIKALAVPNRYKSIKTIIYQFFTIGEALGWL